MTRKLSNAITPFLAIVLGVSLASAALAWGKKYPDVTDDGLVKIDKRSGFDAIYVKPGADFSGYDKVMIAEPTVSFRKNWERDQNFDRVALSHKVTSEDVTRIRTGLANELLKVFTEEITKKGGQIVDSPGDDVLLLQPAIVDLDVNAPDVMSPDMMRTYTTSAGEMTLNMDVRDSATNSILARVIDHREDYATGRIQISNSVTNLSAARQALRSWALIMIKEFEAAKAHGPINPQPKS